MKRVTTINLNGKAFTVEEDGYDELSAYLTKAEKKLAKDPDSGDIIADLEQAVADKFSSHLHNGKDVVTASEVQSILADMGPVEPTDESDNTAEYSEPTDGDGNSKKLYRSASDQMVAGVCGGLAAYFNVDTTVIRLIAVLLVMITSGGAILPYLIMAIVVPEAKTPEQKAEMQGRRFSAADVINNAKQKTAAIEPAFASFGRTLGRIFRVVSGIGSAFFAALAIFVATLMFNSLLGVTTGAFRLQDQLSTIPMVAVVLALVCFFYLVIAPLVLLAQSLFYVATKRVMSKQMLRSVTVGSVLWVVAGSVLMTMGIVNGSKINNYVQTHDKVRIYGNEVCINDEKCGTYRERIQHYLPNNTEMNDDSSMRQGDHTDSSRLEIHSY